MPVRNGFVITMIDYCIITLQKRHTDGQTKKRVIEKAVLYTNTYTEGRYNACKKGVWIIMIDFSHIRDVHRRDRKVSIEVPSCMGLISLCDFFRSNNLNNFA